ncbi:hypothetical protein [Lysobacter gummosus]|uniref:hypothetical protein n=1 Tax=Lysobacter gummosus TaxID=262324 RepID=UPI00363E4C2A
MAVSTARQREPGAALAAAQPRARAASAVVGDDLICGAVAVAVAAAAVRRCGGAISHSLASNRFCPSFPRRRAPLYFGGAEHPGPFVRERLKSLDSRLRGNDGLVG